MDIKDSNMTNTLINDMELLETMMKDMENAPPLFKPTKYWKYHENIHLKWLENMDLNQFRSMSGGGECKLRRIFLW